MQIGHFQPCYAFAAYNFLSYSTEKKGNQTKAKLSIKKFETTRFHYFLHWRAHIGNDIYKSNRELPTAFTKHMNLMKCQNNHFRIMHVIFFSKKNLKSHIKTMLDDGAAHRDLFTFHWHLQTFHNFPMWGSRFFPLIFCPMWFLYFGPPERFIKKSHVRITRMDTLIYATGLVYPARFTKGRLIIRLDPFRGP